MAGIFDELQAYIEANTPRNTRPAVNPAQVIDNGLLGGRIGQIPQRAQEMYQGLLKAPAELRQLASPESAKLAQEAYQPTVSSLITNQPKQLDKDKAMAMAMDYLQTTTPVGGLAGMFIGKGAKTWDAIAAQQADDLLKQGLDPRDVWKQTGTLKGVDGALRQEIPDNLAKYKGQMPSWKSLGNELPVSESFTHDNLYSAYPEIANTKLVANDATSSARGSFDGEANKIYVDAQLNPKHQKQIGSTTLHELQHAIQQREGWARGGSPEQFTMPADLRKGMHSYEDMARAEKLLDRALRDGVPVSSLSPRWADDKVKAIAAQYEKQNNGLASLRQNMEQIGQIEDPMDAYRRLAGEAEARLTQSRMGLDAAKRLQHYPYDQGQYGLDVPIDSLIVRGLLNQ